MKRNFFIGLGLSLILSLAVIAEIPRSTQKELKDKSPEKVVIEVKKVEKVEKNNYFFITVHARIRAVKASSSRLKKGDDLVIKYSKPNQKKQIKPGSWVAEVKPEGHYNAYIRLVDKDKKLYEPAALSATFDELKKDR